MKKKGMTGPMALWCNTDQPAPVRMKPRAEYFEPTSPKLVEKLLKILIEEEKEKRCKRGTYVVQQTYRKDGL